MKSWAFIMRSETGACIQFNANANTQIDTQIEKQPEHRDADTHKDSQEAQQGSQTVISTLGCTPQALGAQGFAARRRQDFFFGRQPADFACPLFSACNLHKFFMCPPPFVCVCVFES